ncbi:MAG: hypothetical protein ACW992_07400, partial [Candidatus Thorarchaeota archaeon]
LEVIDHILEEWQSLPAKVKSSDESRKLKEVISTFSAWFGSYLDLLTDFNRRFDERLKKIERNLLLTQI